MKLLDFAINSNEINELVVEDTWTHISALTFTLRLAGRASAISALGDGAGLTSELTLLVLIEIFFTRLTSRGCVVVIVAHSALFWTNTWFVPIYAQMTCKSFINKYTCMVCIPLIRLVLNRIAGLCWWMSELLPPIINTSVQIIMFLLSACQYINIRHIVISAVDVSHLFIYSCFHFPPEM